MLGKIKKAGLSFLLIIPIFLEIFGLKNIIYINLSFISLLTLYLTATSNKIFISKTEFKTIVIIIVFVVINTIFSKAVYDSYYYAILYINLIIFYILAKQNKDIISKKFIFIFITLTAYTLIIGTILVPDKNLIQLIDKNRQYLFSPSNTSHFSAVITSLPLIMSIPILLSKKPKTFQIITAVLMLPLFFFFLASYMRSAYLALLISLCSYLILYKIKSLKKRLIVTATLFLIAMLLINKTFLWNISKTFNPYNLNIQNKPVFGREDYFISGIMAFLQNPFLGNGLNTYSMTASRFIKDSIPDTTSHNVFIDLINDLGIAGFFLIFMIINKLLKSIKTQNVYNQGFLLSCLSMLITSQNFSFFRMPAYAFFFVLLLSQIDKSKNKSIKLNKVLIYLCIFSLFFISQIVVIAEIISANNINLAKKINPLNINYYRIDEIAKNSFLKKLTENDYNYQLQLYYEYRDNNTNEALKALERYSYLYPRGVDLELALEIYELNKKLNQKLKGINYIKSFLKEHEIDHLILTKCPDKHLELCLDHAKNMRIPRPNFIETTKRQDLNIEAKYTINSASLNETKEYSKEKPNNVYRILVLGDASAFGFLVDTQDNWTEKLEKYLNEKNFLDYKRVEVINFSYHSYDLNYALIRFIIQGVEYNPDLIIIMNNDFYRINEKFIPLTQKYATVENNESLKEKLRKEGKFFPSWDLAWEEYVKTIKPEEAYIKQKEYLNQFYSYYKGPTLFISLYDIPQQITDLLKKHPNTQILELTEFRQQKENYYKEPPYTISPAGHTQLAKIVFNFLKNNYFSKDL